MRNLKTFFVMDEGTAKAVDGVSFEVQPGQVVGIVGESGCGKSVTVKSVLRIIQKPGQIVAGEILFRRQRRNGRGGQGDAGTEIVDLAALDAHGEEMRAIRGSEIALIPQEPMAAMSPVHTIGNQLVEAVRLHLDVGKAEAERIVIGRMREVGIPSPAERMTMYPWELSGGLRQRVMIAMALVLPSQAPDRGRADHGDRRDHPGPGPEPAARAAGASRHGDHLHHARSRRDRADRRLSWS